MLFEANYRKKRNASAARREASPVWRFITKGEAMKTIVTKSETKARKAKPSKVSKARKGNPSKLTKASKAKPSKPRKGGGRALTDFANDNKIKVINRKEIPTRAACFKSGQTVSANLAKQKAAGFKGRRKFIRLQIKENRISLS